MAVQLIQIKAQSAVVSSRAPIALVTIVKGGAVEQAGKISQEVIAEALAAVTCRVAKCAFIWAANAGIIGTIV